MLEVTHYRSEQGFYSSWCIWLPLLGSRISTPTNSRLDSSLGIRNSFILRPAAEAAWDGSGVSRNESVLKASQSLQWLLLADRRAPVLLWHHAGICCSSWHTTLCTELGAKRFVLLQPLCFIITCQRRWSRPICTNAAAFISVRASLGWVTVSHQTARSIWAQYLTFWVCQGPLFYFSHPGGEEEVQE